MFSKDEAGNETVFIDVKAKKEMKKECVPVMQQVRNLKIPIDFELFFGKMFFLLKNLITKSSLPVM